MTLVQSGSLEIDQAAVLQTLGINAADPASQALLLICQRYNLDALLKHVVLIPSKQKDASGNWRTKHDPYITRDGFLHIAHTSGVFNGMEVTEETETASTIRVKVAVWRRDMSRPFTATGTAKKNDERSKADPYDMALTRAERRALRRAFNVGGVPDHEPGEWEETPELYDAATGEITPPPQQAPKQIESPQFEEPPLPDSEADSAQGGGTAAAPALPLTEEAAVETVKKAFPKSVGGSGGEARPASNPFLRSIATAAKRADINDEALNALVEETTGLRSLNDITEPTDGNKVLEAITEYRKAKA